MTIRRHTIPAALLGLLLIGTAGCSAAPAAAPRSSAARPASVARIALPAHPKVYFFGDSWTKGATAASGRGFPTVVGETLGWTVQLGPDNSGAGYVHTFDTNHALFPESAAGLPKLKADLIVLEGGLNDGPGPLTDFWDRVALTVKTLRAKAGGAPVVLVGPASPDGTVPEGLSAIDYEEAGVAKQLGIHYISPIKEGWFTPSNVGGLVDPTTVHPNTAGHAYYAGRLAADLQRITTSASSPTESPTPSH